MAYSSRQNIIEIKILRIISCIIFIETKKKEENIINIWKRKKAFDILLIRIIFYKDSYRRKSHPIKLIIYNNKYRYI